MRTDILISYGIKEAIYYDCVLGRYYSVNNPPEVKEHKPGAAYWIAAPIILALGYRVDDALNKLFGAQFNRPLLTFFALVIGVLFGILMHAVVFLVSESKHRKIGAARIYCEKGHPVENIHLFYDALHTFQKQQVVGLPVTILLIILVIAISIMPETSLIVALGIICIAAFQTFLFRTFHLVAYSRYLLERAGCLAGCKIDLTLGRIIYCLYLIRAKGTSD